MFDDASNEKILVFYDDDTLFDVPDVLRAITYKQYMNKRFKNNVLYTNETSALDFDNFRFYDSIIIHTYDNRDLKFYKPHDNSSIVLHNTNCKKELRLNHNLRKLYISGMFES